MRRLGFDAFVLVCAAVAFLDFFGVEEYELGYAGVSFEAYAVGVMDGEEAAASALVAGVPDGGAEGGAVPEEGGPCAGDGGYVEGHVDGLVVDDLIGALGEAVPAFWVGF